MTPTFLAKRSIYISNEQAAQIQNFLVKMNVLDAAGNVKYDVRIVSPETCSLLLVVWVSVVMLFRLGMGGTCQLAGAVCRHGGGVAGVARGARVWLLEYALQQRQSLCCWVACGRPPPRATSHLFNHPIRLQFVCRKLAGSRSCPSTCPGSPATRPTTTSSRTRARSGRVSGT